MSLRVIFSEPNPSDGFVSGEAETVVSRILKDHHLLAKEIQLRRAVTRRDVVQRRCLGQCESRRARAGKAAGTDPESPLR